MGIERSENNPSRVFDMNASRKVKEATGIGKAIPVSTEMESPSFAQHADQAIAMGNSGRPAAPAQQKTKSGAMSKVKKAANYVWKKLDLVDYPDY